MAPEQARGEAVDQRADVYAFGLILRDMLLGSRDAGATTEFAELMSRMKDPPAPMRARDATIPEPLDALVTRCLQPDPAARYQTSADLLADLERVAEGGRVEAAPPGRRRARPAAGSARRLLRRRSRPRRPPGGGRSGLRRLALVRAPRGAGAGAPGQPDRRSRWPCSRSATRRATRRSIRSARASARCWRRTSGETAQIRAIPSVRLREVLRDLRIDPSANLVAVGPGPHRRLREREDHPLGPVRQVRRGDPDRRDAAGPRAAEDDAAQGDGRQPVGPARGGRPAGRVGAAGARGRVVRCSRRN